DRSLARPPARVRAPAAALAGRIHRGRLPRTRDLVGGHRPRPHALARRPLWSVLRVPRPGDDRVHDGGQRAGPARGRAVPAPAAALEPAERAPARLIRLRARVAAGPLPRTPRARPTRPGESQALDEP